MIFAAMLYELSELRVVEDGYSISDDRSLLDLERVHSWLKDAYWSPGVAIETVRRAAENSSLVIGVYFHGAQVAYCRIVSDKATFAWVCDVWVDEAHRKNGLAKAMVRHALKDPEHQHLRRWLLATKDAHSIYSQCGFEPLPMPERWMVHLPWQNE